MKTANKKFTTYQRYRGEAWNDAMRETAVDTYNNSTNRLPDYLREVGNPFQVNTLIHLGWDETDIAELLDYANKYGDFFYWSEVDWDEILYHFQTLEQDIYALRSGKYETS